MKRLLLTSCLVAVAAPAWAWDNTTNGNHNMIVDGGPGSQANSAATASSASRATSASAAQSRIVFKPQINVAAPTALGGAAGSATPLSAQGAAAADPSATTSHGGWHGGHGSTTNIVEQFPPAPAYAAPLAGGPCNSSGVSGGAQTAWFGLSFAHQRFDYGCAGERMGNLMTVGQKLDWAYQCQDDERFRRASASIGMPCPGDEQRQAVAAPVSAAPVAYVAPPAPRPKWCKYARITSSTTAPSAQYLHEQCGI